MMPQTRLKDKNNLFSHNSGGQKSAPPLQVLEGCAPSETLGENPFCELPLTGGFMGFGSITPGSVSVFTWLCPSGSLSLKSPFAFLLQEHLSLELGPILSPR